MASDPATPFFRVSEIYTSVQGEGPRTGQMTQFIRFAGCNLRCPGWPCDTQHAIDPDKYRDEWKKVTFHDLAYGDELNEWPRSVTLTGGEPFLQPTALLCDLVVDLVENEYRVDCFSNGTLDYPEWAIRYIDFVMDWKLMGAGEHFDKHLNWQRARYDNARKLKATDAIKFVIKDIPDLLEARDTYVGMVDTLEVQASFYVGRTWDSEVTDRFIVDFITKHELPWSLNVQLHKYIWSADTRGV